MGVRRLVGRGSVAALGLLSLCMVGAAHAADTLPNLPVARDITSKAGTIIRVRRSTKNDPLDIAGYKVRGALGYSFGDNAFRYAPAIIKADGGERLKFTFVNEIDAPPANYVPPPQAGNGMTPVKQNIHTHGLVTSPCINKGFVGDDILLTVKPKGSGHEHATDAHDAHAAADAADPIIAARATSPGCGEKQMRTVVGSADYEIAVPSNGASGLYWFHPHIHGVAETHVSAGLSGVILIGSLCRGDHLLPADQQRLCKDGEPTIAERVMMLKDTQLADIDETRRTATLRAPYDIFQCGSQTHPIDYAAYKGECAIPSADGVADKDKWLFTINGAQYPTVVVGAGKQEIWRLANVSADVTYSLSLLDSAGKEMAFEVINIDGNYLPKSVRRDGLVMMPGTRADILVSSGTVKDGKLSPFRKDETYQFVQRKVITGGPNFPGVALAKVVFKGAARGEVVAAVPAGIALNPDTAASFVVPDAVPEAGKLHYRPAECRNKKGMRNPTVVFKDGAVIGPGENHARGNGQTPTIPLTFGTSHNDDVFFIDTNGQSDAGFDMSRINLCVEKGATLKFEVENDTPFAHNLHIHQTRFVVQKLEYERDGRMNRPNIPLDHFFDAVKAGGKEVPVQRDTAPVPVNGTVTAKVTFTIPGRFVYHCHFLLHEDLGMMQIAEVFESKE